MVAAVGAGRPAWAAAEPTGDCTTTAGVIVAVDFAHWGGPVLRACGTTPTTSYTLLNQGGWHTSGDEHDGPAFICRIGYAGYQGGTQYPTAAQEACVLTPPSTAYWAFWYANPGQDSWTYSPTGAMSTNATPGSVELWTFGGTTSGGTSGSAVPGVSPGSLRATNASPPRTVTNPGTQKTGGASDPPTTPATTHAAAASHSPGPTSSPSQAPSVRNAPPTTASAPAGHGSAAPAILALVIVVILAAIGITAVLRRPRREQ
ncbi:MAG TPA: hypothetical protein VGH27_04220 [Streptosporangiaceae bacterium]